MATVNTDVRVPYMGEAQRQKTCSNKAKAVSGCAPFE